MYWKMCTCELVLCGLAAFGCGGGLTDHGSDAAQEKAMSSSSNENVIDNLATGDAAGKEADDGAASVDRGASDGGADGSADGGADGGAGGSGLGTGSDRSQGAGNAGEGSLTTRCFPLDGNPRWEYEVEVTQAGKEPQRAKATRSLGGKKTIAGKEYVRVVTESTIPVPDQYCREASDGVYAAVQGAQGSELLILPADPARTDRWTGSAPPAVKSLEGRATVRERYRIGDREYTDCIKVSLTMTIVERGLFGSGKDVSVRMDRWFAPGIGMVAEIREVSAPGESNYLKSVSSLIRSER